MAKFQLFTVKIDLLKILGNIFRQLAVFYKILQYTIISMAFYG